MKENLNKFTLSKEERLHSKLEIDFLFAHGKKHTEFPLVLIYCNALNKSQTKVILLASKRIFPKAHQRNKAKRILKEVYRLNKNLVPANTFIGLSLINKKATYSQIEDKFKTALTQLH